MSRSPRLGRYPVPLRLKLLSLTIAISLLASFVPQSFVKFVPTAEAASPNIVISQVYGGGGNSGAPYKNDFIELFNRGTSPVTVNGWSVQYASNAGTTWQKTDLTGTIQPGGYYLVQQAAGAGTTMASLPTPQATGGIQMSASAGKVALVASTTALTGSCPTGVVDFVGFGGANCSEGSAPTPALSNSTAALRGNDGCTDTDVNSADFSVGAPTPRNSATPAKTCPSTNLAPSITAPANPIITVNQDAPTFNVSLTGNDDGGIYSWSATAVSGISSVNIASGQGTSNVTYAITLQPGFSGTASFTASLSDSFNTPATTRTVNIAVTPAVGNDPPTITAFVNPIATVAQDAAPFAVNFSGTDDNNIFNWSATAGTGISAVTVTSGQGTANATYTVTLAAGFSGTASFTATLSDNINQQVSRTVNITVTPAPPPPLDHLVISQIYGGGGNSGATFRNDYVELYNPTTASIDVSGWTVQYASSTGSSWQAQPLGGVIAPGEYYLVSLASGGAVGASLPAANIDGEINISGTTGKVALVKVGAPLSGTCPVGDPNIADLVGYGTANCKEGATNAPAPSNTTAIFRKNGGFTDTNVNGADFITGTPNPRRTAPITEIGPAVLSTDPRPSGTNAPRDANIAITFTELVEVSGAWFNIECANTGLHNDATYAQDGRDWIIIPNVNFQAGEQCTVTINKDFVRDQDLDDGAPNTDYLAANYSFSFTVATGTAPAYSPDVHLTMGNPSGAEANTLMPNNYLMMKPEFTLSYNRDKGTPNWVSWHLSDEWVGTLSRVDTFRADPAVPSDWYRVLGTDYSSSGFDRGHMVPNADRDKETSIPINQATFLMTNILPQSPDNNQGPWANMENYLRTLLPANELYIVAGGAGSGGTGSSGFATEIAGGKVKVPAFTWKVVMVLPKGTDDVSRVTASTRTIAVIMPNIQGIRNDNWQNYIVSIDQVEALTGYDFFTEVNDAVEYSIEAGINGVNPPATQNISMTIAEGGQAEITLIGLQANNNPLTYTVVTNPSHGTLTGTGATRTYTPAAGFNGTDTFTYKVNDGPLVSNTSTVTINVTEVNDAPAAADDAKGTQEDTPLSFTASNLTSNDSAGSNETGQNLTVKSVTAGGETHGTVSLEGGQITYTPEANYNGPASFTYDVCDDGTTSGLLDSKCDTATVNINVAAVNDNPVADTDSASTDEDTPVTVDVRANDSDVDGDTVSLTSASGASKGTVSVTPEGRVLYTPNANANGADSFTYVLSDGQGGTANGTVNVTINSVNDAPSVSGVPATATIAELSGYTFTAQATDVDGDTPTFSLLGAPAGAAIDSATGQFTWTPTEAQGGTNVPFQFTVRASDGTTNVDTAVAVTVTEVNQSPTLTQIGNKNVLLGGTQAFTAQGADADLPAQTLTYSLTGSVPAGASINPTTGQFTWTPTAAQAGQTYTFGVRVTDDGPGQLHAEEVISVGVGYEWSGVLAPIRLDGKTTFKQGSNIPVKFKLTGASAGITNATVRLLVAKISNDVIGTEEEAVSTSSATAGNLFRYDASEGQYIFNLSTKGLTPGTYQLRIDMGDGVLHVITISLRG